MPLSKKQIIALATDARKAFASVPEVQKGALRAALASREASARIPEEFAESASCARLFDAWRRREVSAATGGKFRSFRELGNDDFIRVRAHFIRFYDAAAAARVAARIAQDERRRLLWRIEKVCAASGSMAFPAYPATLCDLQYGVRLADADAKTLRCILITVTSRARARDKKAKGGAR